MSWDMRRSDENEEVTVKVVKDGETTREKFSSDTPLGEAVEKLAMEAGLKNVIVTDAEGNEIDDDQSDEQLGDFPGPISITAKAVGA